MPRHDLTTREWAGLQLICPPQARTDDRPRATGRSSTPCSGWARPARPGATCRSGTGRGGRWPRDSIAGPKAASGSASWPSCSARATRRAGSTGGAHGRRHQHPGPSSCRRRQRGRIPGARPLAGRLRQQAAPALRARWPTDRLRPDRWRAARADGVRALMAAGAVKRPGPGRPAAGRERCWPIVAIPAGRCASICAAVASAQSSLSSPPRRGLV